ncbi:MAG: hypothetical protein ABL933_00565 [Methyloglobulus sp.]|nr:hypothetical protein [Methyloglobulus sp.]
MKLNNLQRWVIGLSTLILFVAASAWFMGLSKGWKRDIQSQPLSEKSVSTDVQSPELIALQNELKALKEQVKNQQSLLNTLTGAQPSVTAKPDAQQANNLNDPISHTTRADVDASQRQQQDRINALENDFQQQSANLKWSATASNIIQDAFENRGKANDKGFSRGTIKSVECRTSMCRVEINQSDHNAYQKLLEDFPREVAAKAKLPRMITQPTQNPDGTIDTLVFLSQ